MPKVSPVIIGLALASFAFSPAAVPQQPSDAATKLGEHYKLPQGYLPRDQLPDSLGLLPPPPASGSAALQRDEEARQQAQALRGSARYKFASSDAVIGFPEIPNDFSCAAGFAISEQATPKLYKLMGRMLVDVGLSTYGAKQHYQRTRPFVVHSASTCYPKDEAILRGDGSYPSGHSAIGWGVALMLAEVNPARTNAILRRGLEFGQSRLICDAHWQSDIDAGRVVAAAAIARLHASPEFRSDLEAARAEVSQATQTAMPVSAACTAEAAALAN